MELEDLKKLSPKERLKKLEELKERDRKEIEEAEKLIKQSKHDAEQEEIDELVRRIKKPELKDEELEDKIEKENVQRKEHSEHNYDSGISHKIETYKLTEEETYDKVKNLVQKSYEGTISEDEKENLNFYESQFKNVNPDYIEIHERGVVERTEELLERMEKYT